MTTGKLNILERCKLCDQPKIPRMFLCRKHYEERYRKHPSRQGKKDDKYPKDITIENSPELFEPLEKPPKSFWLKLKRDGFAFYEGRRWSIFDTNVNSKVSDPTSVPAWQSQFFEFSQYSDPTKWGA